MDSYYTNQALRETFYTYNSSPTKTVYKND